MVKSPPTDQITVSALNFMQIRSGELLYRSRADRKKYTRGSARWTYCGVHLTNKNGMHRVVADALLNTEGRRASWRRRRAPPQTLVGRKYLLSFDVPLHLILKYQ
jgi:hypothetical protein